MLDTSYVQAQENNPPKDFYHVAQNLFEEIVPATGRVRLDVPGGPLISVMRDHNTAYRDWEYVLSVTPGIEDKKVVLLHFDFHSDLLSKDILPRPKSPKQFMDYGGRYEIETFIFPAIYHGIIDEVYYITPRLSSTSIAYYYTAYCAAFNPLAWARGKRETRIDTTYYYCRYKTGERYTYYGGIHDPRSSVTRFGMQFLGYGEQATSPIDKLGQIPLHVCYVDDIHEDFSQDNVRVIVDIDEDYFNNNDDYKDADYATEARAKETIDRLIKGVEKFLLRLKQKPLVVTIALSPGYTPESYMPLITRRLLRMLARMYFARRDSRGEVVVVYE